MDSSAYRSLFAGFAAQMIAIGVAAGILAVGLGWLVLWLLSHIAITWK